MRIVFLAALFGFAAVFFYRAPGALSALIEPNRALLSALDGLGTKKLPSKRDSVARSAADGIFAPRSGKKADTPFDAARPREIACSPFASHAQRDAAEESLKAEPGKRAKRTQKTNTPFDTPRPIEVLPSPFASQAARPAKREAHLNVRARGMRNQKNVDLAGLEGLGRISSDGNISFGARRKFAARGPRAETRTVTRHGVTIIKGGTRVGQFAAFELPEQTRFPRYYRAWRPWATGKICRSPAQRQAARHGVRLTYGTLNANPRQSACGRFRGGATDQQGSPYATRIEGGPTVEQGSPWAGAIEGGPTVRQGSPWRGTIRGGRTVEQGSAWASRMPNWRFRDYDPARFPAQTVPRRRARSAYSSRLRGGRTIRSRAPWAANPRY